MMRSITQSSWYVMESADKIRMYAPLDEYLSHLWNAACQGVQSQSPQGSQKDGNGVEGHMEICTSQDTRSLREDGMGGFAWLYIYIYGPCRDTRAGPMSNPVPSSRRHFPHHLVDGTNGLHCTNTLKTELAPGHIHRISCMTMRCTYLWEWGHLV